MRRILVVVAASGLLLAACGGTSESGGGSTTPSASGSASVAATAAACAQQNSSALITPGTLTVGTDNPAYSPFYAGGTESGSEWKINDPNTGKGFESAVAYEIAKRMGFTPDQVKWVVVPFAQSYAPGPKTFDMNLTEVTISAKRAQAVDFSDSYYDNNQALVVVKGTPIASATSLADLKQYTLGAPLGTTGYDVIKDYIGAKVAVYQKQSDAVAALNAGQIDGIVVDLPTAVYMADPYVQEVKNSIVLAQFPTDAAGGSPDHFGVVLAKGSPLTQCVNLALQEMKADGTLQATTTKWLSQKTNVGEVPVFSK